MPNIDNAEAKCNPAIAEIGHSENYCPVSAPAPPAHAPNAI